MASSPVHVTDFSRLTPSLAPLRLPFPPQAVPFIWYRNTEDENWLAVNPNDPDNIVITTHQDKFNFFLADILPFTLDGGKTWNQSNVVLSRCQGPTLESAANDWQSSSDPFVTFDHKGNLHYVGANFNLVGNTEEVIAYAKSTDGGRTFNAIYHVVRDDGTTHFQDKPAITANPHNDDLYVIWSDQLVFVGLGTGTIVFNKSTDGGSTWSGTDPANYQTIYTTPSLGMLSWGAQLHVLPFSSPFSRCCGSQQREKGGSQQREKGGDLVVISLVTQFDRETNPLFHFTVVLKSSDQGETWSQIATFGEGIPATAVDPDGSSIYRTFDIGTISTVNRCNGYLYAAWQQTIDDNGTCGVLVSMSKDGGHTWSSPINPNVSFPAGQTFYPALAVLDDGLVGISFYDFRNAVPGDPSLATDVWLVLFDPELQYFLGEIRLTPTSFDIRQALWDARTAEGLTPSRFLGDYRCLQAHKQTFYTSFAVTNPPYGVPNPQPPEQYTEEFRNRQDVVFAKVRINKDRCFCERRKVFPLTFKPKENAKDKVTKTGSRYYFRLQKLQEKKEKKA